MKKVFHVYRSNKSRKTTVVGDFDTLEAAKEAMLEHYRNTPKRGQFWYVVSEDNLKEIGGVMFRETCYFDGSYHRTFKAEELKAIEEARS